MQADHHLPALRNEHLQTVGNGQSSSAMAETTDPTQNRTLLQIAWERKLIIVLGVVVGVALSYLWYKRQVPVYQASARVLVLRKGPEALPIPGIDPRLSYLDDYVATQQLLIRSPVILSLVAKNEQIQALPWGKDEGQVISRILAALNVVRGEGREQSQNVLRFVYTSNDPIECGIVLRVLTDSYKQYLESTYTKINDDTVKLIENAMQILNKEMVNHQEKYNEFRNKVPVDFMRAKAKEGVTVNLERLETLQGKVSALVLRESEIDTHLKYYEEMVNKGTSPAVLRKVAQRFERGSDPSGALLPNQSQGDSGLTMLLLQESQLQETYGPDYSGLKKLRSQIARYRQLEDERNATVKAGSGKPEESVDSHLAMLKHEKAETVLLRKTYQQLIEDESKRAKDLVGFVIQEETLSGNLSRTKDLYQTIVKRLDEINLLKNSGGYRVEEITPAPRRGTRTAPVRDTYLAGGLAVGLFLGFGLVYLAEITNKSFRSPVEISRRLGMGIIGHVPALPFITGDDKDAGVIDQQVVVHHKPKSKHAEAFRQIRTALYFNSRGFPCKTIQITSPKAGDGKTTVSTNLAACIAQSGKRVLIIDADCHRPRVKGMYGLQAGAGLTDILLHGAHWSDVVSHPAIENLTVLTSGTRAPNPAELLTGDSFPQLLEEVSKSFDLVIVDSPPLLAVSDPAVVAVRVDGVVLVVRIGRAERLDAERAALLLKSLKSRVLGVVVNGCEPNAGYRYYYGYNYYYKGYGYGSYGYRYSDGYSEYYQDNEKEDHDKKPQSLNP